MARQWQCDASVGNLNGVYDAAYNFSNNPEIEARVRGTASEIAEAIRIYLESFTDEETEAGKYGTSRFFVQFEVMALPEARS
jgi:hypothetical protein